MRLEHILTKYKVDELKLDDETWLMCLDELKEEIKKQHRIFDSSTVHSLAINNLCKFVGW
jgi:hypothetical protein